MNDTQAKRKTPAELAEQIIDEIDELTSRLTRLKKREALALVRRLERIHYAVMYEPESMPDDTHDLSELDLLDGVRAFLCSNCYGNERSSKEIEAHYSKKAI